MSKKKDGNTKLSKQNKERWGTYQASTQVEVVEIIVYQHNICLNTKKKN